LLFNKYTNFQPKNSYIKKPLHDFFKAIMINGNRTLLVLDEFSEKGLS